jgi:hypothetical protein
MQKYAAKTKSRNLQKSAAKTPKYAKNMQVNFFSYKNI